MNCFLYHDIFLLSLTKETKMAIKVSGVTVIDDSRILTNVKTKTSQEIVSAITASTATTTVDLSTASTFIITMSANTTLAFTNVPSGSDLTSFSIITVNDSVAGRTLSWPASIKWAGGQTPTRTTTASKSDLYTFFTVDAGTNMIGSLSIANY